ncbi:MAG: hypothetical protein ACHQFX_06125 [Chitinophagales bacterium]
MRLRYVDRNYRWKNVGGRAICLFADALSDLVWFLLFAGMRYKLIRMNQCTG